VGVNPGADGILELAAKLRVLVSDVDHAQGPKEAPLALGRRFGQDNR
jgi:hypothetical protein